MQWWEALLLGIVQGLTEFLPVSSSGHLIIFKELLGVENAGFLDFTLTVHFATVLSTIVVFWKVIWEILKGVLKFKYNDETDYFLKMCVSMVPVAIVGLFLKDKVEALFGEGLSTVACCLIVTAALLFFSDFYTKKRKIVNNYRNGISYWQAALIGLGQAFAVAPGISRSGTTIATGLLSGVKRENMAQFSFLMVLVPIMGEQFLSVLDTLGASEPVQGLGFGILAFGFLGAFLSGLFACKAMVALVRRSKLSWFSLYCVIAALVLLILS